MSKTPTRLVVPAPELLVAVEALIRSLPTADALATDADEILAWRGRAIATISAWNVTKGGVLSTLLEQIDNEFMIGDRVSAMRQIRILFHEARQALVLLVGVDAGSVAMSAGAVFEYFSELTNRLQLASRDVLFVDPYLDATFAERYLPQIRSGVLIRLLTAGGYVPKLLPAIEMFVKQNGGAAIELREASFHDRFVFIDGAIGFQSGASFKDGAAKAPTGLIEIVDTLPTMLQQYEALWKNGKVHR